MVSKLKDRNAGRSIALNAFLFALFIVLVPYNGHGGRTRQIPAHFDDPLLYSHSVVLGTVVNVTYERILHGERFKESFDPQIVIDIATVQLSVSETLRGTVGKGRFNLLVHPPGLSMTASGKWLQETFPTGGTVLVCSRIDPEFRGGQYVLQWDGQFLFQNGVWTSRGLHGNMQDSEIRELVRSGTPATVTAEADVVVVATIESRENVKMDLKEGAVAGVWRYKARVRAILKGKPVSDVISFFTFHGPYYPSWSPFFLRLAEVGDTWYVFLRKSEYGYYPFAGLNGMYRADANELVYDESVRYSKAAMESIIRFAAEHSD